MSSARVRSSVLACALIASLGCSHDLDALKAERDNADLRDGGAGSGASGSGSGAGGRGGGAAGMGGSAAGGDGGAGDDAGAPIDAGSSGGGGGLCEPCPDLTEPAMNLGLRACCRGATDLECGLTFGEGTLCLPRDVPGQENDACPPTMGQVMLDGCCRPDGRCGVLADQVALGCVARDEILPALGMPAPAPIACMFSCTRDGDCGGLPGRRVCAETADRSGRYCAQTCDRDRDCNRGTICALSVDVAMDRVLAICREPVGEAEPGQSCAAADDCVNAVCTRLMSGDNEPFCTELCSTVADCGPTASRCVTSQIPTPSGESSNGFDVCLP